MNGKYAACETKQGYFYAAPPLTQGHCLNGTLSGIIPHSCVVIIQKLEYFLITHSIARFMIHINDTSTIPIGYNILTNKMK